MKDGTKMGGRDGDGAKEREERKEEEQEEELVAVAREFMQRRETPLPLFPPRFLT
jgi:hypothetical protein